MPADVPSPLRLSQPLLGVPGAAAWAVIAMPWRQMTRSTRWGWCGAGLLLLGSGVAFALLWQQAALAGAGLGGVLLMVWGAQVAGLLEQNDPRSARLVPGHLRVLRRVAVALWLMGTLVAGVAAWVLLDGRAVLPACVLAAGLAAAVLAWCIRWPLLWFVISFAPMGVSIVPGAGPAAWFGAAAWWQANSVGATAALLGLLGASLFALFGAGDARHQQVFARQRTWREMARDGRSARGGAAFGAWGAAFTHLGRPVERLASWWLGRLLRRARPEARSVMARAEVVLHGQHHWLYQLVGVMVVLVSLALALALGQAIFGPVPERAWADVWRNGSLGIAIGLANMGLNGIFLLPRALCQSRREQALLVLLPGMPQGPSLSRAVAGLQVRHLVIGWLLTLAFAAALLGPTAPGLVVPLGALPLLVAWVLRPPARLSPSAGWKDALPIIGFSCGGTLLVVVLVTRPGSATTALGVLATLSLLLSLALAHWRARQRRAAPAALPAGRWG